METNPKGEGTPIPTNLPIFWSEIKVGKKINIAIETHKLIEVCSHISFGYYNYVDYSGNPILIRLKDNCIIHESRPEEIKQSVKNYLINGVKRPDVWAEFAKRNIINDNFIHLIEKLPVANFNPSKRDEAFFFYDNGVVKATRNSLKIIRPNSTPRSKSVISR